MTTDFREMNQNEGRPRIVGNGAKRPAADVREDVQRHGEGTPTYLTTRQACERLRISQPTLSRWVASGKVEVVLRGEGRTGAQFFHPDEIERLEAER